MITFTQYNKQQRKLNKHSSEIVNSWKQHQKEGTFLNGESCLLDGLTTCYLRSNPGEAYKYQIKGETYISVKHIEWNTTYWEVFEKPLSQLNVVCY